MKNTVMIKRGMVAAALACGAVSSIASAGVSGSAGLANLYLWRGLDISAGRPAFYGSLDYHHASGLYAGIWGSSEGPRDSDDDGDNDSGTSEYDLYAGYGNQIGDLMYDLSYVYYNYPSADDGDLSEVVMKLGYAGFSAAGYFGVGKVGHGSSQTDNRDNYFTLAYHYGQYGILVGTWDRDASDSNYTHVDLSYALTDQLAFTLSKVVDAEEASGASDSDDPLFVVSYTFKF